jgi:hypothetical protein
MIKRIRLSRLFAILLIGILSVVPGQLRPHLLASGQLEHFGAYCVAGFILGFGYFGRLSLLTIAVGLSIYSGILEIAQLCIPGRGSRLIDCFTSSAGRLGWNCTRVVALFFARSKSRTKYTMSISRIPSSYSSASPVLHARIALPAGKLVAAGTARRPESVTKLAGQSFLSPRIA